MIAIPIDFMDINVKSSKLFIKIDSVNASTYLDLGTATQNCKCICS